MACSAIPGTSSSGASDRDQNSFASQFLAIDGDADWGQLLLRPPISSAPAFFKVIGKCPPACQARNFLRQSDSVMALNPVQQSHEHPRRRQKKQRHTSTAGNGPVYRCLQPVPRSPLPRHGLPKRGPDAARTSANHNQIEVICHVSCQKTKDGIHRCGTTRCVQRPTSPPAFHTQHPCLVSIAGYNKNR